MPLPRVDVLGPVRVRVGHNDVTPGSRTQRCVLAALVAGNGSASTDALVDAIWEDTPPPTARRSLQSHISRVRTLLGGSETLTVEGDRYRLHAETDAAEFTRIVDGATEAPPGEAVAALEAGFGLWRGPAFGEFADEPFARPEATRLEELALAARESWALGMLELGRHGAVVAELEPLVASQPFREGLWSPLVTALHRSGRHPEALRALERHREALAEIGLEPSPAMQALEDDVLLHRGEAPAGSGVGGALPARPTTFVGRDTEVATVIDLLDGARLVTLTGLGGVGKTRLAIEAARRMADHEATDAWFVRLGPVVDPQDVPHAVAAAVGVQPTGDATEAVVASLRPRSGVVVLDDCERVVGAVADLAERLLHGCPGVRVLATSRTVLAAEGEHVLAVGPLSQAESVDLFVDRAMAARPGRRLDADDHAAIAEICERLDGLPLAVEMAAARTRSMSPAELAADLDERFLRHERRLVEDRQATLNATLEWSYEGLSDDARRLFDHVSVFAGSFSSAGAVAVAPEAWERRRVVDAVDELVAHSLLTVEGTAAGTRYRMLGLVARFGRGHLAEAGILDEVGRRHAKHLADVARDIAATYKGPDEGRAVTLLGLALDDLREAHRWAFEARSIEVHAEVTGALHFLGQVRTGTEILGWSERLVQAVGDSDHPRWSLVLASASASAANRGDLETARQLAERAADRDDPDDYRYGAEMLSDVALYEGNLDEALRHAESATASARAMGDDFLVASALVNVVLAHAYGGNEHEATLAIEELRQAAERSGSPTQLAWADYLAGEIILDRDPEPALSHLEAAADRARAVGNDFVLGVALVSAITLRSRTGDPREAVAAFPEVIRHWRAADNWTHQWTILRNLVVAAERAGLDELAATVAGASEASGHPAFGDEAARFEASVQAVRARLGTDQWRRTAEAGAAMSPDALLDHVLEALEAR